MDDLLGEDWQAPAKSSTTTTYAKPSAFASNHSSFRASAQPSTSGISSLQQIIRPATAVNGNATQHRANGDAFGSLLRSKSKQAGGSLSMQERQKQLLEEKRRQQAQQAELWDTLGSGRGSPEVRQPSPTVAQEGEDEDDILAAFNKAAPVDKSSHYPAPPSTGVSGRSTPAFAQVPQTAVLETVGNGHGGFDDDDDPFGLGAAPRKRDGHTVAPATTLADDDDDVLGDLGKPVSEWPAQKALSVDSFPQNGQAATEDRALAELVDMGFPPDTAKIALAGNGGDVQSAVGWLLQQAHEQSKQEAQAQAQGQTRLRSPVHGSRSSPPRQRSDQGSMPAWMREKGRSGSTTQRQDSRSPANGEADPAMLAQEYSQKLFKGATSIWKAGQKQMAKTMAEFQRERDHSQPRWMQQEASANGSRATNGQRRPDEPRVRQKVPVRDGNVTDEAAMLDAPCEARPAKPVRPAERFIDPELRGRSRVEDLPHRPSPQPRFMQQEQRRPTPPLQDKRAITKLSRQEIDDQTAQAYVSPARRKRPTPKPEPQPGPEVDLFSPEPVEGPTPAAVPGRTAQARASPAPTPVAVRPKAPSRDIPSVSPSSLTTSAQHRKAGGEAFKRGDYAAAYDSYTAAIGPLPPMHPILIIVLCNRSLTALKTGDTKTAVSDADRAMEIIGPSQGSGESIDLGSGEGSKDMKQFFGKALMRKAEALEHVEKWTDAASVWQQAIEAGVGGAVSLSGRDRCEKAAAPKHAAAPVKSTAPAPRNAPPAKALGNSMHRSAFSSAPSAEAVKKLRAANAAAEKADHEKFALTDAVDAKLTAWRGGKTDNLRALLQSMDAVLWEGAGWKKVGMSDLVMPNKVKVVYMKAIGKVHPDKIPQDATTEQRMISASVFSTLNEAWDKFKTDNNL